MNVRILRAGFALLLGCGLVCGGSANPFTGKGAPDPGPVARPEVTEPATADPAAAEESSDGGLNLLQQVTKGLLAYQKAFHAGLSLFLRQAAQEGVSTALALLLLFGFLYGVFHTLLPGHQKAVISAYFLTENARYRQGFLAGAFFAVFHAVSAVAIIVGIRFIFKLSASGNLDTATFYTQLFSSLGVVVLGVVLLIFKIRDLGRLRIEAETARVRELMGFDFQSKIQGAVTTIPWKKFMTLLFFAGLLPCPGSLLVLLFAVSLGQLGLGIAAVLAISLGMAVTLTSLSLVVIFLKRRASGVVKTPRGRVLQVGFEILGTLALMAFSLLLLPFWPTS